MVTLRQDLCLVIFVGTHSDQHHLFRQVNISALCILLVDGCDHQLIAQKELIVHLLGIRIVCKVEGERTEHHLILQGSL